MSDRYVVVSTIRATTLAMRDEKGFYRTVLQMTWPFDRSETALQLCNALNAIDAELTIPSTPALAPKFVGTKP